MSIRRTCASCECYDHDDAVLPSPGADVYERWSVRSRVTIVNEIRHVARNGELKKKPVSSPKIVRINKHTRKNSNVSYMTVTNFHEKISFLQLITQLNKLRNSALNLIGRLERSEKLSRSRALYSMLRARSHQVASTCDSNSSRVRRKRTG